MFRMDRQIWTISVSFYCTDLRKKFTIHFLRSIENNDFNVEISKPGVHFFMIPTWAYGVFNTVVYAINLWAETAKARGQQTYPIQGQIVNILHLMSHTALATAIQQL